MKLRIDPDYLAGLLFKDKRIDVEHCYHVWKEGEKKGKRCGVATRHGKFFCLDHVTEMPYASMVHALVEDGYGREGQNERDEYEAA